MMIILCILRSVVLTQFRESVLGPCPALYKYNGDVVIKLIVKNECLAFKTNIFYIYDPDSNKFCEHNFSGLDQVIHLVVSADLEPDPLKKCFVNMGPEVSTIARSYNIKI